MIWGFSHIFGLTPIQVHLAFFRVSVQVISLKTSVKFHEILILGWTPRIPSYTRCVSNFSAPTATSCLWYPIVMKQKHKPFPRAVKHHPIYDTCPFPLAHLQARKSLSLSLSATFIRRNVMSKNVLRMRHWKLRCMFQAMVSQVAFTTIFGSRKVVWHLIAHWSTNFQRPQVGINN